MAAALAALFACVPIVQAQDVSILYYEQIPGLSSRVQAAAAGGEEAPQSSSPALSFTAFGRQFDVALERNHRLTSGLQPAQQRRLREAGVEMYAGSLVGVPGSWVRLTREGSTLSGLIADGPELYAIEPFERAERHLAGPAPDGNRDPIIYRVSDTIGLPKSDIVRGPPAGEARKSIAMAVPAPAAPARQLHVGFLGDFELSGPLVSETHLASIVNMVDGIFSQQVGIHLNLVVLDIHDAEPDPFTATESGALLEELGMYKLARPGLRDLGLLHLVTGRNLTAASGQRDIVGLANLSVLCAPQHGVALTENVDSLGTATALIVAHEMGHNFGAPHDAEAGSACATTAPTFIMNPTLNNRGTFSACSVQQMQPEIARAACLVPIPSSDVAVRLVEAPTNVLVGQLFSVSVALDSLGLHDAVAVTLRVSTGMRVLSIAPEGVNIPGCDLAQGTCWFPRIAAGGSKAVRIYATAIDDRPGSIEVAVSAGGDANTANDTYLVPINAAPAVDFRDSRATPLPPLIRPGEETEVRISLVNTGTANATNVRLRITLDPWFDFVSFTAPGGGPCVADPIAANVRVCPLPDAPRFQQQLSTLRVRSRPGTAALQPGQMTRAGITFVAIADQPDLGGDSSAIGANVDITPNIASLTVEIQPPSNPMSGASADVQLVARNAGPDDVGQVAVELNAGGLFAPGAARPASCAAAAGNNTRCEVGPLRAGEARAMTFRGTVGGEGSYFLSAIIQGSTFSSAPSSVLATVTVASAPPAPPPSSPPAAASGGGGGGGAADPVFVLALLLIAAGARVRRSRRGA